MSMADRAYQAVEPAPESLGIDEIVVDGQPHRVLARTLRDLPFAALVVLSHAAVARRPPALVVPPLSGHTPLLLRDLVGGLLRSMPVAFLDWREPRRVPLRDGPFGFDDNILHVAAALRALGPDTLAIALCQSVVPSLAAAALIAADDPAAAPRGLVLMAGPVDPLAQPTRVVELLRAHPLDWFRSRVITSVPAHEPGAGRLIYPASAQRTALLTYLTRHMSQGGELFWKAATDDGADPIRHPFLRLFLTLMDLPAELFLDNIATVFHDRRLCSGTLSVANQHVDLAALTRTALMTIEGERDDIAAPGQTRAAHPLCTGLPADRHHHLLVKGSGHFSLFYGETWRREVLPAVAAFDAASRPH